MSGIAGILRDRDVSYPEQRAALDRMLRAQAARGPDAQGSWDEGPISLGLAVFRTTPEQIHECGPVTLAHVVVLADARLDDRELLLADLSIASSEHATMSDGELIARAYLRWG